jgi:hypothetical protein
MRRVAAGPILAADARRKIGTMHDYTAGLLNEHRLAQFDAEADASRLATAARASRRPSAGGGRFRRLAQISLARATWRPIRWAFAWVRGT